MAAFLRTRGRLEAVLDAEERRKWEEQRRLDDRMKGRNR